MSAIPNLWWAVISRATIEGAIAFGLAWALTAALPRAGANLRQIQELLGHKHLDSTQRYTRVTAHELRGAVKRLRGPVKRLRGPTTRRWGPTGTGR